MPEIDEEEEDNVVEVDETESSESDMEEEESPDTAVSNLGGMAAPSSINEITLASYKSRLV